MSTPLPSLSWPEPPQRLPLAPLRPVLDRFASLAVTHPDDVTLVPGLAAGEEEHASDAPPALEQLVDELGGLRVGDREVLQLLVEERTDVGPYTMLGEPTSYYPLAEGDDVAVVLTLGVDGLPGAVYGIGDDLALRFAAPDLGTYLDAVADVVEGVLAEADRAGGPGSGDASPGGPDASDGGPTAGYADVPGGPDEGPTSGSEDAPGEPRRGAASGSDGAPGAAATGDRAALLDSLLDRYFFVPLLGPGVDDSGDDDLGDDDLGDDESGGENRADDPEDAAAGDAVPVVVLTGEGAGELPSDLPSLPEGTVAVADLRRARPGDRADLLEADLPGDPLDHHLAWAAGGLVIAVVPD